MTVLFREKWKTGRPPLDVPFELNRESPLADGLVGWWPMAASRGTSKLIDMTGRGNDGVFDSAGAPARYPDWKGDAVFGSTLYYDGVNDRVLFPASTVAQVLGNSPRTISTWLRTTNASREFFIYYGTAGAGQTWAQSVEGAVLYVRVSFGNKGFTATGVNNGNWHLIVFTFNGTHTTDIKCYMDGVELSVAALGNVAINTTSSVLHNGTSNTLTDDYLGNVNDITIWNRALSPAEIWQLWAPETRWSLYKPLRTRVTTKDTLIVIDGLAGSVTMDNAHSNLLINPPTRPIEGFTAFDISNLNNNLDDFDIIVSAWGPLGDSVIGHYNITSDGVDVTVAVNGAAGAVTQNRKIELDHISVFASEGIHIQRIRNSAIDRNIPMNYYFTTKQMAL